MEIFDKLTENDKKLIGMYRDYYASPSYGYKNRESLDYILRVWDEAKSDYLYDLLGKEFIIKRDVQILKDNEDIKDDLNNKLFRWGSAGRKFVDVYEVLESKYRPRGYWEEEDTPEEAKKRVIYNGLNNLMKLDTLACNEYTGDTFSIRVDENTILSVNRGCKASRILGKIAKSFNLDNYEEFRIAHSLALNDRTLKGRLCLSIHPLDFMTMSDNNCNWTSCMSWEDSGEYRRGTVEMMNSPMVVCAYLESEDPYHPFYGRDFEWNSKRWRELFIVTPALICGIKGYPFWNRDIESQTIMILRELAQTNLGWGPYNCEPQTFKAGDLVEFKEFGKSVRMYFYTDAMYCDFCYSHQAVISCNAPDRIETTYSGYSECMNCGDIHACFDHEGELCCCDCDEHYCCYECGDSYDRDELYEIDGEYYCEYCADNLPSCEICNETHSHDDMCRLYFASNKGVGTTYINICYDCMNDGNDYFARREVWDAKNGWSYKSFVNLEQIDPDDADSLADFAGYSDHESLVEHINDSARIWTFKYLESHEDCYCRQRG